MPQILHPTPVPSEEAIRKFIDLYEQRFGVILEDGCAADLASKLLLLVSLGTTRCQLVRREPHKGPDVLDIAQRPTTGYNGCMNIQPCEWFTALFGVEVPQYMLPFVDFRLDSDVPLYIDPYAITKDPSELAQHCTNAIVDYFQRLLDAISRDHQAALRHLLTGRLAEPVQVHLGVARRARRGRGIGSQQEVDIVTALRNSTAARTGLIETIQELELHVPHIGSDKVSDLTGNIILGYLARFTEEVCSEYGISMRPCPVDGFWNTQRHEWDAGFFNLPSHDTNSYVLVPKRFVRRQRDLMNHKDFYEKYILTTLQRELLTADDSLVRTLRSGERGVDKSAIRDDPRFGLSKAFIGEFIVAHPDSVVGYRSHLMESYRPVDPAEWSGKHLEDDPEIEAAVSELQAIRPGKADEARYHRTVLKLVVRSLLALTYMVSGSPVYVHANGVAVLL